jgi:hypothetical protein
MGAFNRSRFHRAVPSSSRFSIPPASSRSFNSRCLSCSPAGTYS